MSYTLGIDVSHHQKPNAIDWKRIRETQSFCIARASYGVTPDETFVQHFSRAQEAGLTVGAYLFLRQTERWQDQHEAFEAQLYKVMFGVGNIVPVVDLEWNEDFDGPVKPKSLSGVAQMVMAQLRANYGSCLAYLSPAFFEVLGKPDWLKRYPWWIANHTEAAAPWCPYKTDWSIWQHSANGRISGYSGPLDLNRARELPLVKEALCTDS